MKQSMKKLISLLIVASFSLTSQATDIVPGEKQIAPILIKGGTLNTVTDGIKVDFDLLLKDGVISQIGQNIAVTADTKVIDAKGKQVYPGLIGMVTNLGLVEIEAVRATIDTREVGSATPEVQAHIAYNADSEIIPTIRSNGVSHAQVMPSGSGFNGQSSLMQLDAWNWQDALIKSNTGMHLRWPSVGINKAFWETRPPEKQKEANQKALEDLFKLFDQVKAYAKSRDEDKSQLVDIRWEAMLSVLKGQMPLYVHAEDYRQIEQAIHFAQQENIKLILVGARDADKAIELIKRFKVPVVFTSAFGRTWRSDEAIDKAFATPALLAKEGISYVLAIDSGWPVRDLPFAAGQSIAYGVSPATALESITIRPAEVLGVADKMGSLTVGKQANVVISSGDIMDHLTHKVETLLIEGREVDLDNRQKRLYRKYSEKPKN